jgi:hypothetical protein
MVDQTESPPLIAASSPLTPPPFESDKYSPRRGSNPRPRQESKLEINLAAPVTTAGLSVCPPVPSQPCLPRMPRFTTSLLLGLLLVLGLLSASCRGTSTAPTDAAAAAVFPESQALHRLDRRVIIRPRPRPDVDPDTGGGAGSYPPSPGGRYPGDPPPSRNKDDDDNNEVPELPDGGDAATTKPSVARCTTSCNAAATGTSSSETITPSSSPSPTQLPIANESARHGARLSLALAGILPLLVLLLA